MPIYAYRCSACGHAKDVLQKLSDPVLSTCPACGAATFSKQVTAAGFQLKGSGWYATDFKGSGAAPAPAADAKADSKADSKADPKPEAKPEAKADAPPSPAPAAPAPAAPSAGH
ncbi:MAG: zinc ribbon domain-containing protein [Aquabacterium sp.]|nr:zinc ribbon domain-containing protein [Aquabacterium sp.]